MPINMNFKTKYIFKNQKTGWAVDFGICGLMSKGSDGKYSSKVCESCYSVRTINMYPNLRKKLEEIDTEVQPHSLEDFKSDIEKIKKKGLRFIRFYGFGDWTGPSDNAYIKGAAEILPVELFSKRLHFAANLKYLKEIAGYDNVRISLSFNKELKDRIEPTFKFLKENNLLDKVQLNYTFIGDEEVVKIPYISVYHTTKRDKLSLAKVFGHNRICCARTEDGKKIENKEEKGSCLRCYLCKLPAANANGNILVPRLLSNEMEKI